MNELYHHGIKGQKWGIRRYQNKDGSLTEEGRLRYSSDDIHYKKGSSFYRYSNKKESGSLQNAYVMRTNHDIGTYYMNAKHVELGFKDYEKIYMTKITALDDITIRKGKNTIKDLMPYIGDQTITVNGKESWTYKAQDAYDLLEKDGYFDKKSWNDRNEIRNRDKEHVRAVKALGKMVHHGMYSEAGKKLLKKYSDMKYDAIVDPEDYIYNYNRPMIITNESKFKRNKQSVIYDKSYSDYKKEMKEKGKEFIFETAENIALHEFINKE